MRQVVWRIWEFSHIFQLNHLIPSLILSLLVSLPFSSLFFSSLFSSLLFSALFPSLPSLHFTSLHSVAVVLCVDVCCVVWRVVWHAENLPCVDSSKRFCVLATRPRA